MISLNLSSINLGGCNLSEIKLGYPSLGSSPIRGLSGVLGLYMGKGLTNEGMSANPVWRDKSGRGHHLQMKNFGWKLNSGVGLYQQDFNGNRWFISSVRSDIARTSASFNVTSIKELAVQFYNQSYPAQEPYIVPSFTIKVSGLVDGQTIRYRTPGVTYYTISSDGIYNLPSFEFEAKGMWYGFFFTKLQESCNITIEQIPEYPGAICFDGIDDYAICENFPVLTKEKGYTVMALRRWLSTENKNCSLLSKRISTPLSGAFGFESINNLGEKRCYNFGDSKQISLSKTLVAYQTSNQYNGDNIPKGQLEDNTSLVIGRTLVDFNSYFANAAIYSLVIIDHDTTAEERQLVIDYWKKEYPELTLEIDYPGIKALYENFDKSNDSPDRNIVKDLVGGNNILLKNMSYNLNSGYGRYVFDYTTFKSVRSEFTATKDKIIITKITNANSFWTIETKNVINKTDAYTIRVTGLDETSSTMKINYGKSSNDILALIEKDGVYVIPALDYPDGSLYGYTFSKNLESCNITIEQLPDYKGALCFDGVTDYGESEKEINFNDEYTVVTMFVPFVTGYNQVLFGKDYLKDVYCNYNSTVLNFYSTGRATNIPLHDHQLYLFVIRRNSTTMEIKNLLTGETGTLDNAPHVIDNPGKFYIGRGQTVSTYTKCALYAQEISDRWLTDEEIMNLINDRWKDNVKELLFDQGWTVTGKTNEDTNKATVTNLLRNGNNLTLSNVAFAESSGYGKYFWDFNSWKENNTKPLSKTSSKINLTGSISSEKWGAIANKMVGEEVMVKTTVKITGLSPELPKMYFGKFDIGDVSQLLELKDGINVIDKTIYSAFGWYGFGFREAVETCDVTIEQIPDYEGYLVTDGVDDCIVSTAKTPINNNYTIVGNWEFMEMKQSNSGIAQYPNLYIYNRTAGLSVQLKRSPNTDIKNIRSLKAIRSDGVVYGPNWEEYIVPVGSNAIDTNWVINIASAGVNGPWTKMAFKNLAIYNNTLLTKEQCITAYNYLQTLKNK